MQKRATILLPYRVAQMIISGLTCTGLYKGRAAAGWLAELYVYTKGNHDFGMRKQNLPSDKWINQSYDWMLHSDFSSSANRLQIFLSNCFGRLCP